VGGSCLWAPFPFVIVFAVADLAQPLLIVKLTTYFCCNIFFSPPPPEEGCLPTFFLAISHPLLRKIDAASLPHFLSSVPAA
jgi:hypothetical protein